MRRLAVGLTLLAIALVPATAHAAAAYTSKDLQFDVAIGPGDTTHCTVDATLYKPADASAANPAPAVLATNGFGNSKTEFAQLGPSYASRGFVFLAYSGLGFGNSTCKIELDDPDWDGKAASQLVSFLGGSKAATDNTKVDYVIHDPVDHTGVARPDDPRVGMIGGSYGGEIQFAVAEQDPRVDAIVPQITWNDLSYSLAPNNTSQTSGVTYATPGTEKLQWVSLFFGLGIVDGIEEAQTDPSRDVGCPNFDDQACVSKAQMDALGYPDGTTLAFARHASVASYIDRIRIPTLLAQGQNDTLFDLNEATATYEALRARGVPVKMLWRFNGHSGSDLGIRENRPDLPEAAYESRMELEWLDWYLRGVGDPPALDFSYLQDWALPASGDAGPAVASAPAYPAAPARALFLSGSGDLVAQRGAVKAGSASFAVPPAGAPTSYSEISAKDPGQPPRDAPGSFAAFSSAPLPADLDVVGIPRVTLRLSAPTYAQTAKGGPGGMLVLFVKLYDVAPDGSLTLPHKLIAPIRVADPTQPFTVTLPGIVHRFAAGHRLELVVAAGDAAYKGDDVPGPVSVTVDPSSPSVLEIPALGPGATALGPVVAAAGRATLPAGAGGLPPAVRQGEQSAVLPPATARAHACTSRRHFTIHLRRRAHDPIVRATVLVAGRRVEVLRGRRLRAAIVLAGLPRGTVRVTVVAVTRDRRTLRSARTYHTCTPAHR